MNREPLRPLTVQALLQVSPDRVLRPVQASHRPSYSLGGVMFRRAYSCKTCAFDLRRFTSASKSALVAVCATGFTVRISMAPRLLSIGIAPPGFISPMKVEGTPHFS